MSQTPRTNTLYAQFGPVPNPAAMAYYSLCCELERACTGYQQGLTTGLVAISESEFAALREDKARLDFLLSPDRPVPHDTRGHVVNPSTAAVIRARSAATEGLPHSPLMCSSSRSA